MFVLILAFSSMTGYAQDNLLKRKVQLSATDQPLEDVLLELSDKAKFTFSYDASILKEEKISVSVSNVSVKTTLDKILPNNVDYKVSGNHLILLRKFSDDGRAREKYTISGHVYNKDNGAPLKDIVVYEISSLISAVTDEQGAFTISVPAQFEQLGLSFNQKAVQDTVILIAPKDQNITISLVPVRPVTAAEAIRNITFQPVLSVESVSLVQQVVSSQMMLRTENTGLVLHKVGQFSFFPTAGTNLKMSGLVENNFSLNVFIGYAYGVNVVEVGGLFNVIRNDVKGFQAAGLGNVVGENIKGIQVGGVFNHNKGSLTGVQVGGVSNKLVDSLRGFQVAGVNNILKGGMKGVQIAGVNNLTTRTVDGVQIGGLTNIAREDVRKMQIAGLLNMGRNVEGVQLAGVINLSKGEIRGVQLAGVINKGKNVKAIQLAGVGNIAGDTVSGTQIASVFNKARYVDGRQIGLVNIADSSSSTPIGFFSFVKKGYRAFEVSSNEVTPVNVAFKTGVKRLYNIFSAGYGSWRGGEQWSFGYGLGAQWRLSEKGFMNFEYTAHWVNEEKSFQKDLSLLHRLDITFGKRKARGLTFSAGPSINVWLSEWKDPETGKYLTQLAPYTLISDKLGTTLIQFWVGGKLAVQF